MDVALYGITIALGIWGAVAANLYTVATHNHEFSWKVLAADAVVGGFAGSVGLLGALYYGLDDIGVAIAGAFGGFFNRETLAFAKKHLTKIVEYFPK